MERGGGLKPVRTWGRGEEPTPQGHTVTEIEGVQEPEVRGPGGSWLFGNLSAEVLGSLPPAREWGVPEVERKVGV